MLRLFDTAAGAVRPFEPRTPGQVSMYVCGPTVYGPPHLGHGRFSLVFDVLRRYLEWSGIEVIYVSNITDIDDKIIERANAEGRDWQEITSGCEAVWYRAMDAIGVKRPTHDPHATAYVPQMVELIARLIAAGAAYETDDGVYFRPRQVADYGLLARQDLDSLQAGARVDVVERQGNADRLRPLEEGEAGRAVVAVAVGRRSTGLAHRVRRDVARHPRRRFRPARRRSGPVLPAPRERAGAGRRRRPPVRPPLGAQRLRRGGRREDVEVARQLHEPARSHRACRSPRLPHAVPPGALPVAHRREREHDHAGVERARAPRCAWPAGSAVSEKASHPTSRSSPGSASGWTTTSTPAAPWRSSPRPSPRSTDTSTSTTHAGAEPLAAAYRTMLDAVGLTVNDEVRSVSSAGDQVASLCRQRDDARAAKEWARADSIRDELQSLGWLVEDTPSGTQVRKG